MELESSYNLLGVVRDDGIRTYRAIEIGSGEEMQVHLFAKPDSASDRALFRAIRALPVSKRRELLEIGIEGDTPYVVTAKLPDSSTAREWLAKLAGVVEKPSGAVFLEGSWKTGTPIPEELVKATHTHTVAPAPKQPAELTPDYTRVMRVPETLSAVPPAVTESAVQPPEPPAAPVTPPAEEPDEFARLFGSPPPQAPATPQAEPGEFTRMFLASQPAQPAPPVIPAAAKDDPGEFTRQFLATQPSLQAPPVLPPQPPVGPQGLVVPQSPTGTVSAMFPAAKPQADAPGEFTSMFLAAQASQPPSTPPAPPADLSADAPTRLFEAVKPAASAPEPLQAAPPSKEGQSEFTRFFQSPMYPTPAGNQRMPQAMPIPSPQTNRPSATPSEFTQMFGNPNKPASAPLPPLGSGSSSSATGVFSVGKQTAPTGPLKGSSPNASGPGEFTRMMSASAPPTLGQPVAKPAAAPEPQAKSNLLLYVAGACVLVAIILIVVFLVMRG